MRVRTIEIGGEDFIESIVVEMSAREAALIARMMGATSHADRNEIQHDGGSAGTEVYFALTELFNRFYENGIDEVPR